MSSMREASDMSGFILTITKSIAHTFAGRLRVGTRVTIVETSDASCSWDSSGPRLAAVDRRPFRLPYRTVGRRVDRTTAGRGLRGNGGQSPTHGHSCCTSDWPDR